MGRNVVAHGTPDRSFAGLMDHLTGFSREGASSSDSDSDFGATFRRTSKPDSEFIDGSLTNPRYNARPMLPITERKPGRAAPPTEATALSYEKALQIHGRRRGLPTPPLVQPAPTAQSRQATATACKDAITGVRKTAPKGKAIAGQPKAGVGPAKSGVAAARSDTGLNRHVPRIAESPAAPAIRAEAGKRQTQPTPDLELKTNGLTGVRRRKRTADAASSIPTATARAARRTSAHTAEVREASKTRSKGKSPGKASRESLEDSSASRFVSSQNPAPGLAALREQIRLMESSVEVMPAAPVGSTLELLQTFGELGQVDQRRTIVSVRLTEGEFACLRERAEESGISVSAYMRSCVVDADQLRAQVKRALAEMRSLSVAPGGEPRTALTASGHRPSETSGWNSQGWFRLMLRPLASLFGPLFPARRSA